MPRTRKGVPVRPTDSAERTGFDASSFLFRSYLALILLFLGFLLLSLGPLKGGFWGFHLLAFLPLPVSVFLFLLSLGSAAMLWRGRGSAEARPPGFEGIGSRWLTRGWGAALALALTLSAVFWLLRPAHVLLGDGVTVSMGVPIDVFYGHFPLTKAFQFWWFETYRTTLAGDISTPQAVRNSVGMLSTLAGFMFVLLAYGIGRILAVDRSTGSVDSRTAWLTTGLLVSQGYMLIFFGYVEHYGLLAAFLALYVFLSLLCLRGRVPLAVPAALFVLLLGIHMSSFILAPSLLFLFGWSALRQRLWPTLIALATLVASIALLNGLLDRWQEGFSLWQGVREMLRTGSQERPELGTLEYMFSSVHLRDFINEHFLLGPFAAFLLLPALVVWLKDRRARNVESGFLLVAALTFLAATWVTKDPRLGYARDWDIFAAPALTCAVAGLSIIIGALGVRNGRHALLGALLLFSFAHLSSWVLVNHSEARGIERFAHLPLGFGRTEVALGNYYQQRGDSERAREWMQRAVLANPAITDAYGFLGQMALHEGDTASAVLNFRRAASMQPERLRYRAHLAQLLMSTGRFEEALPHVAFVRRKRPDEVVGWMAEARALRRLSRLAEARVLLERGVQHFLELQESQPGSFELNMSLARIASGLGNVDLALESTERAVQLRPDSEFALLRLGLLLRRRGMKAEARPYVQRLLELNPAHPGGRRLAAWISQD